MRALTPQVWNEHHAELTDVIVEAWPTLTAGQVHEAGDDFEALAAVIAGSESVSVDEARRDLLRIEVDERELGAADPGESITDTPQRASLAQLRLGTGFAERDRDMVVGLLEKLDRRLEKFRADATELEISVKNRGETDQSVTLEAWLPRLPHFAVTSDEPDLRAALQDVRESLWRQIDDAVTKRRAYE